MEGDSFFRRWAMRKADSRESDTLRKKRGPQESEGAAKSSSAVVAGDAAEPHVAPTLDDVARLTAESDYSPFVARGTDPAVRRAALKTLFSDPHFHAIDGLDVYIGDYTRHVPLTPAMLAALQHVRSMSEATQSEREQSPQQAQGQPRPVLADAVQKGEDSPEQAGEIDASNDADRSLPDDPA